jgi:hypothetical protein
MTRRSVPPDQPALLPIEDEAPQPVPNDLTRAWCNGYSSAREGRLPHPNIVKRVGRVAKNIGADCVTLDDWRAAWRAAYVAGRTGRWDITACLIDEQPRSLHRVGKRTISARQAVLDSLHADAITGTAIEQ